MQADYVTTDGTVVQFQDDFEVFKKRIRLLAYQNGSNYAKLSKALSLPPNIFYRYENGTRTPELRTLIALSQYFNVSIEWLLGYREYADKDQQKRYDLYQAATTEDKAIIDAILNKYEEVL